MCPVAAAAATTTTRWCPTPEQLMILEEMYKGGVRTPNATQIQHITSNLSLYGKIEGKNVFYWFQNHKARDRKKLRRRLMTKQLCSMLQQQQQQQQALQCHHNNMMEPHQHFHCHDQQQSSTQFFHHFIEIDPPISDDTSTTRGFHGHHVSHPISPTFHAQVQRSSYNRTPSSSLSSCRTQQQQPQDQMMMMDYTWKIENPAASMLMSRSFDGDGDGDDNWVMILEENVGPVINNTSNIGSCWRSTTSLVSRPPLKTLDLFPTTATGLKQLGNHDHRDETSRPQLLQVHHQAPEMFPVRDKSNIDAKPPAIMIIN